MKTLIALLMTLVFSLAVASPATPTDDYPVEEEVWQDPFIGIKVDTPRDEIEYGEPVVLRCVIEGMYQSYRIKWQHSVDKINWVDVAYDSDTYELILSEDTAGTYYRVVISTY